MFGKFIIECDTEYFGDATDAAKEMILHKEKEMMTTVEYGDGTTVRMFCRRLKRSISVRQVKP